MKCLDILCKPETLFVYTIHIHTRAESYLNAYQFSADRTDSSSADCRMCQITLETRIQGATICQLTSWHRNAFLIVAQHMIFSFFLFFKVSHFGPCKQELLKQTNKNPYKNLHNTSLLLLELQKSVNNALLKKSQQQVQISFQRAIGACIVFLIVSDCISYEKNISLHSQKSHRFCSLKDN